MNTETDRIAKQAPQTAEEPNRARAKKHAAVERWLHRQSRPAKTTPRWFG